MKNISITFLFFISAIAFAGNKNVTREISGDPLIPYIDSLKTSSLRDTMKFKLTAESIHFTTMGRMNSNGYSPLFIINNRFFYKLDIIPPVLVKQFVNEFLDAKKIQTIAVMNKKYSITSYASRGVNGVIMINLKPDATFNTNIAGFEMVNKNSGNNFSK